MTGDLRLTAGAITPLMLLLPRCCHLFKFDFCSKSPLKAGARRQLEGQARVRRCKHFDAALDYGLGGHSGTIVFLAIAAVEHIFTGTGGACNSSCFRGAGQAWSRDVLVLGYRQSPPSTARRESGGELERD